MSLIIVKEMMKSADGVVKMIGVNGEMKSDAIGAIGVIGKETMTTAMINRF
jgi:hypothetical protein